MSMLEYNMEIINKIELIDKQNKEIIKSIKQTIKGLGDKPKDLDLLKEGLDKLTNELSIIRCEYTDIYNEYMLFNGKFLAYNPQDNQQILIFLANTVIQPEECRLISDIQNSITKLLSHYNKDDKSNDYLYYHNNAFRKFDNLSDNGKIIELWNQILISFQEWSLLRSKIVNQKKIIKYINYIKNQ